MLVLLSTQSGAAAPVVSLYYTNSTHRHAPPPAETAEFGSKPREFDWNVLLLVLLCLAAIFGVLGVLWAVFERRRRRENRARAPPIDDYRTQLCDCLLNSNLRVWAGSCLFTPVLAAFNRADADDRDCSPCDVCFNQCQQYATRQTIRGRYGLLQDNTHDVLSACCCTPCAVAQDTLELEHRALLDRALVQHQLDEEDRALQEEEDLYFKASRQRRTATTFSRPAIIPGTLDQNNKSKLARYEEGPDLV